MSSPDYWRTGYLLQSIACEQCCLVADLQLPRCSGLLREQEESKMRRKTDRPTSQKNEQHGASWGGKWMALLFLTLTASLAYAKPPKMSKELAEAPSGSKVDVIVQFTKSPTAYHFNKVLAPGGTLKRNFTGVIKWSVFPV